jgi:hypothetical protein
MNELDYQQHSDQTKRLYHGVGHDAAQAQLRSKHQQAEAHTTARSRNHGQISSLSTVMGAVSMQDIAEPLSKHST